MVLEYPFDCKSGAEGEPCSSPDFEADFSGGSHRPRLQKVCLVWFYWKYSDTSQGISYEMQAQKAQGTL